MTNIVLFTIISLAVIATLIYFVRKHRSNVQAKDHEEYMKTMEQTYSETKNMPFKLKAKDGRLRGQILNNQIAVINLVDVKTSKTLRVFYSSQQVFDKFDCDPEEVRELKEYERILANVRRFRDEEMDQDANPDRTGYTIIPLPIIGNIKHYNTGDMNVLGTNRVVITISQNADKSLFLTQIHFAPHLLQSVPTSLNIGRDEEWTFFKETYMDKINEMSMYQAEFDRVLEIKAEIEEFNKHINDLKFDEDGRVVAYLPGNSVAENPSKRFENLKVV